MLAFSPLQFGHFCAFKFKVSGNDLPILASKRSSCLILLSEDLLENVGRWLPEHLLGTLPRSPPIKSKMEVAMEYACSQASQAKVAKHFDKVWKDECMMCFRSPFSPGGLYVNLNSFQGFCRHHVDLDHQRSGNNLYLHIKQTKVNLTNRHMQLCLTGRLLICMLFRCVLCPAGLCTP